MNVTPAIRIETLHRRDQFQDAVRLQKEIWGFEEIELLLVRLFVVATKVGGQAFGAYDGETMVAFALAIPGIKQNYGAYLHSHMVGVSPAYRNHGIGRALKIAQRDEAIRRSIALMEWTFDPLEIKNAYFNIERLGVVLRRHVYNQYGTTTSVLHGGLPTNRVIAEWWFDNPRVNSAIAGQPPVRPSIEARVDVPNDIDSIRKNDFGGAKTIQSRVSEQLAGAFDRGLVVVGFEKSADFGTYLLGRWQ